MDAPREPERGREAENRPLIVETTTGPFGEEARERTEWSEIDEAELLSPTAGGVL